MISAGGKYWQKAGTGAPEASASVAANITALALMDAFFVDDLLKARRNL
jgi:hypothetical protein